MFRVERLSLIERYAEWLATAGVERGLIGPREAPRLWERHLLNCGLLERALPVGATVADVGSGAGLPGLVVAIARPDLRVTLIEPLLRRTTFLTEVVEDLGLANVTVVRGRADALHGEERFDVVTSRAVAALSRLLEWSMPLVGPGGELVAMKGSSAEDEIEGARVALRKLGCAEPAVELVGGELGIEPTTLVRVAWADPSRVSWPLVPEAGRGGSAKSRSKSARRGRRG